MQFRIRNIVGLAHADLTVEPGKIALIGGQHGAGKTSLTQSIAAALTGAWRIRHASVKKELATVVRAGEQAGVIQARSEKGLWRLSLPDGEMTTEGLWDSYPPIAVGAQRLMGINGARERAAALLALLGAEPAREDLAAALGEHGIAAETADACWKRIAKDGWDATWKAAREAGARKKGEWEHISSEKYGEKKAKTWCPSEIDHMDGRAIEPYQEKLEKAQQALEASVGREAVSADEVRRLRGLVAGVPELRQQLAQLDLALAEATKAYTTALREREALPEDVSRFDPRICPHCGQPIIVAVKVRPDQSERVIEIRKPDPEDTVTDDQLKQRRLAIAGADGDVRRTKGEMEKLEREKFLVASKIRDAAEAEEKLASLGDWSEVSAHKVAERRDAVEHAKTQLAAVKRWNAAIKVGQQIENNALIVAALSPDGVRQTVLGRKLDELNEHLAELSGVLGFRLAVCVRIEGGEVGVWAGLHPYEQLSESEQWRADLVLQAAFAQRSGTPVIVIDRLDLLLPPLRPAVLKLVNHIGATAVITMAAKSAESLPAIHKAGLGHCYWLENAKLEEVS